MRLLESNIDDVRTFLVTGNIPVRLIFPTLDSTATHDLLSRQSSLWIYGWSFPSEQLHRSTVNER